MYNTEMRNLGVTVFDNKILVSVSAPGCDWCRILLRERAADNSKTLPWTKIDLLPDPVFPAIFVGEQKISRSKKYEYIFENENGYFLDPYAKRIIGNEEFGVLKAGATDPSSLTTEERTILTDTLGLSCAVDTESFNWKNDKKPNISMADMFIYKLHVRGFTMAEGSGVKSAGTFNGVCEKIKYLKELGCNAVLLQPVCEFNEIMDYQLNIGADAHSGIMRSRLFAGSMMNMPMDIDADPTTKVNDKRCSSRLNFWGYGAQSFLFAPKASYAADPEKVCNEFKHMVRELHNAGIEVLMELDHSGEAEDYYILDSMRFWASEYHIDGFKVNVDQVPVRHITGDPYLSNLKIIGSGFDESLLRKNSRLIVMNDGYQDTIRRYLKGDEGQLSTAAHLFMDNGGNMARINYIADHNGFTINDCFSYDERHNELNGERNTDGREANYSWNCGIEGATKKRKVLELRSKMIKNALAMLFISRGIPMLCAGDEFGNTHFGNNNPYCCDNEQGWVNWTRSKQAADLKNYVKSLAQLRREHNSFTNQTPYRESDYEFTGYPDISYHSTKTWYPDFSYYARALGILINGNYAGGKNAAADDSFYLIMNMHWEEHEFDLPIIKEHEWKAVFATDKASSPDPKKKSVIIQPRSMAVYILKKIEKPLSKRAAKAAENLRKKPAVTAEKGM